MNYTKIGRPALSEPRLPQVTPGMILETMAGWICARRWTRKSRIHLDQPHGAGSGDGSIRGLWPTAHAVMECGA
jgi:hypothetical protein